MGRRAPRGLPLPLAAVPNVALLGSGVGNGPLRHWDVGGLACFWRWRLVGALPPVSVGPGRWWPAGASTVVQPLSLSSTSGLPLTVPTSSTSTSMQTFTSNVGSSLGLGSPLANTLTKSQTDSLLASPPGLSSMRGRRVVKRNRCSLRASAAGAPSADGSSRSMEITTDLEAVPSRSISAQDGSSRSMKITTDLEAVPSRGIFAQATAADNNKDLGASTVSGEPANEFVHNTSNSTQEVALRECLITSLKEFGENDDDAKTLIDLFATLDDHQIEEHLQSLLGGSYDGGPCATARELEHVVGGRGRGPRRRR